MTSRISGIVPLLLITLVCIGLVEGAYQLLEHFILDPPFKAESSEVVAATERSETKTAGENKIDYQIILQRNLFGPPPETDKSAISSVSKPVEPLTATSLEIVLMGTIIGSEGAERAIILDKKSQKQELYEKGDAVQGALVKDIERGKAIISHNGKDEILDMSEAAKVRPPVISAPVVPGQQSTTPLRVVPRPSGGISPGAPAVSPGQSNTPLRQGPQQSVGEMPVPTAPGNMSIPAQPGNVDRVRTLVPQRIYRPTQPTKKQ
jgi:hypothetical protein